ncbi:hypothetical protein G7Y89_g11735 [Cudoniella acicularis]|uniref:Uncharacterized protein n=1 Tax=Cudoniella acicularis TaxID=354080 RepID=A0A8H4RCX3_9HELO|nr:hypothetical protein G7Y89_g11735 [Cudoniella acicularis]
MTSSSKPSVSLSKVPSVKELCELLGFQYASLKDTNTFMELTRAWRKSYQTSSGRPATDLLSWNQSSDQLDLEEMAQKFIDDRGNGDRFWSPNRSWNHGDSDLHFPEDRARIVALLKQLFWKQNRYAFNNSQYGHKEPEPRGQSREKTTPVRQINPVIHGASPASVPSARADAGSVQAKSKSPKNPSKSTAPDGTSRKPPPAGSSTTGRINTPAPDFFEILDDSDSHDYATFSRLPKRPQPISSTEESPRKKNKYHLAAPLRRTDRKRTIRNFPHAVPDDQLEQLINDNTEVHDRTHNIQPTRTSITLGSSEQTKPRFRVTDVETHSKNSPPHVALPIEGRPAPTAHMTASHIRKSLSPQSKASKIAQAINRSNPNKSSTPSSSQNNSTSPVNKSKPWKATEPRWATEPDLELEKGNSRTSRVESSALSAEGSEDSALQMSGMTKVADTMGKSSEAVDSTPPQPSVETFNAPLDPEKNKSNAHGSTTHEGNDGKPTPTSEPLPSRLELPPAPSGYYPGGTANVAASPEQGQTPSKISEMFKSLPDVSEKFSENPSRLETPLQSTETVENKMEIISTTEPIPTQAPPPKAQPAQHLPPQASLSNPRHKTQIPLWIITREPRYTEERWDDGKFMGTPLPTFIEGISKVTQRSHIEKIKLTLRAPNFDTKITVFKDAEDSWASAKETFIEKLKEAKAEARAKRQMEQLTFKILVEPFYEEGMLPSRCDDEYEDEFDF